MNRTMLRCSRREKGEREEGERGEGGRWRREGGKDKGRGEREWNRDQIMV